MAKIAVPLGPEFEDSEFAVPCELLGAAGHDITVVGLEQGAVLDGKRGEVTAKVHAAVKDTDAKHFDALLIPGGHSPDHLRTDPELVAFVRNFVDTHKLIAAVCHGPQLLIEADAVRGKTMTSWPSVRRDLENAGAKWVDLEVVIDGDLITSRKPADLELFSKTVLSELERRRSREESASMQLEP